MSVINEKMQYSLYQLNQKLQKLNKKNIQITDCMNFLEVPGQEYNISQGEGLRAGKRSINLCETHCSLNSSAKMGSTSKNRKNSFKKMKQAFLNQKNNQGRVVKKMVQSSRVSPKNRISRLDDAMTIYSQDSPKSSKTAKFIIDQSVIILSGKNVEAQPFDEKLQNVTSQFFFEKELEDYQKNVQKINRPAKNNKINLKIVKQNPFLGIITQTGFLVNIQKLSHISKFYQSYKKIEVQGLLKLYNVYNLERVNVKNNSQAEENHQKLSIAFYQAYTQTFLQHLFSVQYIKYQKFLIWISEIIEILSKLSKLRIFPKIEKSSIVLINSIMKFRLNPDKVFLKDITRMETAYLQRQVLRSFGHYLNVCLKLLYEVSGKNIKDKLKGINIFSRLELKQLIKQLTQQNNLTFTKTKKKIKKMFNGL